MKAQNLKLKVVNEIKKDEYELVSFKPYMEFESLIGCIVGEAEILRSTGIKDKNGINVYEGDLIHYHFDEDIKGIVKYGEYKNPSDDIHASHIGFYVDFEGYIHKNSMRKDLGYWLKVSSVCGNIYKNK
ncbi:YopX family protein [Clostridium tertium]